MEFLKGLFMGVLKGFGAMLLLIVVVTGLFLGSKTVRYIQRGFDFEKAIRWTADEIRDQLPEPEENPYQEKEIDYSVNQNIQVVPCIDLT